MTRKKGSSQHWRRRQTADPYVERAAKEGWRARAAFKLLEIERRERLFYPGSHVVDLGAAPGSWCQVAAKRVGAAGRIIAIDRLAMDPIDGVDVIQADFLSNEGLGALRDLLGESGVDLVMSDLAPNISGNRAVDQPRSMALVEEALQFAVETLNPGGRFLTKLFQGEGQNEFERELAGRFERLRRIKPKASRPESREIYLLASNFRMM